MPAVAQFAVEMERDDRPSRRPVGRLVEVILRQVWSIHLRRSGFDDLETTGDPWGPLSNRGSLHDMELSRAWSHDHMADAADYYRRMEHLANRFEDEVDRRIGAALSDGASQMRIKAALRVGQRRIERVAKQLRIWMREPEETDGEG